MPKKFLSSIPHMTLVVIILGLIKQIIYYNNFNFSIISYIGISELGLLVSNDLLVIVPSLLIMGLIYTDTKPKEEIKIADGIKHTPEISSEKPKKKILHQKINFTENWIIVIVFVVMLVFMVAAIAQNHYYDSLYLYAEAGFFFFLLLLILFKQQLQQYIKTSQVVTMAIVVALTCINFILRISKELEIVEKGKYTGTTIITNDSTYISSDSSYYIGKVEKFVFIYNKKDSSTFVVPIESIKKMRVKESYIKK